MVVPLESRGSLELRTSFRLTTNFAPPEIKNGQCYKITLERDDEKLVFFCNRYMVFKIRESKIKEMDEFCYEDSFIDTELIKRITKKSSVLGEYQVMVEVVDKEKR